MEGISPFILLGRVIGFVTVHLAIIAVLMAWPLWVGLARRPRCGRLGAKLTAVAGAIWYPAALAGRVVGRPVEDVILLVALVVVVAFEAWAVWRVVRERRELRAQLAAEAGAAEAEAARLRDVAVR